MSEKNTKYICCSCYKSFTYPELKKRKTIIIDKEHKYSHLCPICNNTEFRILSTIIRN